MNYKYLWECGLKEPAKCILDYQPEEKATRDHPGYPEEIQLCQILVGGIDIMPMTGFDQHDHIETLALLQLHEDVEAAKAELAIKKYEDWISYHD